MKLSLFKKTMTMLAVVAGLAITANAEVMYTRVDSIPVKRHLTDFHYDEESGILYFTDNFLPGVSPDRHYFFYFYERTDRTSFYYEEFGKQIYYNYAETADESGEATLENLKHAQIGYCLDSGKEGFFARTRTNCDNKRSDSFRAISGYTKTGKVFIKSHIDSLVQYGFSKIRIAPLYLELDVDGTIYPYGGAEDKNGSMSLINYYDMDLMSGSLSWYVSSVNHDGVTTNYSSANAPKNINFILSKDELTYTNKYATNGDENTVDVECIEGDGSNWKQISSDQRTSLEVASIDVLLPSKDIESCVVEGQSARFRMKMYNSEKPGSVYTDEILLTMMYEFTFGATEHGIQAIDGTKGNTIAKKYGETVNLKATPDEGYMLECWQNSDGVCVSSTNEIQIVSDTVLSARFIKLPKRTITFLDPSGVVVDEKEYEIDDEPVPPTISVPEDDDTYHYYVKWTPKIEDVTVDQTYRASIEKVLKDPKVVVKVENLYVGSKMKISTPTPCIELEGAQLDPDDYKRILDKENNLSYIEGVDKVQNYTLEAWDWSWYQYDLNLILRLLEDGECADDIIVKTIRYNVEKDDDFVFYVNDHKGQFFFDPNADDEIYATPWLQFHATYGAIDYAYGKSRAIIDGASMAPVLESVNGLTAGDVRFNRDFKAGKYSTIMLPFSTEVSKLADADHASFYGISDIVKVDGKWQVQVAAVSDIEANTPYIVVSDVDLDVLIIEDNVTFNTTEGSKSSTAGDWQFVGTYEYKKWTEGDPELGRAFVIDEMGKLKKIKVGDEQYPLSAYLVDPNVRVVTFFDDKGVQVGDVVTVASGMAVSVPAEPAKREGYTFAGWFQKNAETAYDFSAAVNEDLELYGKWTVNKYEIAVAANDSKMGSVKGAGTYEYGTEVELVATAAEGYKFSNWEDDVKASATRKVKVTAAASYKANFEKIPESSSSSVKPGSSSSSAKSSSSTKPKSSSSKTDAVVAAAAVPQFSLSVAGRNLQIAGARIGSAYAVLDMQGRVLATGRTASASMEIAVPRAGSYMVRVGSQTKRVNVK